VQSTVSSDAILTLDRMRLGVVWHRTADETRAVIDRIAADTDELARARRGQDLNTAAVLPDPRGERRWRLAERDLEFRGLLPAQVRCPLGLPTVSRT
jgi:hypothetical protein